MLCPARLPQGIKWSGPKITSAHFLLIYDPIILGKNATHKESWYSVVPDIMSSGSFPLPSIVGNSDAALFGFVRHARNLQKAHLLCHLVLQCYVRGRQLNWHSFFLSFERTSNPCRRPFSRDEVSPLCGVCLFHCDLYSISTPVHLPRAKTQTCTKCL